MIILILKRNIIWEQLLVIGFVPLAVSLVGVIIGTIKTITAKRVGDYGN